MGAQPGRVRERAHAEPPERRRPRILDAGKVIIDGDRIPGYRTLEGPKFYKRNGEYWIFAPAGGVKPGWQSVFRSKTVDGPYEDRIVLEQGSTDINGPHQGAWVDTPSGEDWFFHFQDLDAYGRVVHLQPMKWREDGWPVMGVDAGRRRQGRAGQHAPEAERQVPAVGRLPCRRRRTSSAARGSVCNGNGRRIRRALDVAGRRAAERCGCTPCRHRPPTTSGWRRTSCSRSGPPPHSWSRRRSTFAPLADGDTAGLIVFGQDYAWIGLRKTAAGPASRGMPSRRTPEERQAGTGGGRPRGRRAVGLPARRRRQGGVADSAASPDNRSFAPIGEEFVAKPGQWVGAKVGLFAVARPGASKAGHADWAWFRVNPAE